MAVPQAKKRFTPAEYYAMEETAEYKSDYYDGEIFAMAGGTTEHSRITTNVVGALWQRLRGKPCEAFESNRRLRITATGLRTYPDVSIYCGDIEYDLEDPHTTTALNPTIVFEVISPTTEAYDRGVKSGNYRLVASLKAYVLIAQDRPHVEVFVRQANGDWSLRDASGLDALIRLDAIGIDLPAAEIYDRVTFPVDLPATLPRE